MYESNKKTSSPLKIVQEKYKKMFCLRKQQENSGKTAINGSELHCSVIKFCCRLEKDMMLNLLVKQLWYHAYNPTK